MGGFARRKKEVRINTCKRALDQTRRGRKSEAKEAAVVVIRNIVPRGPLRQL